MESIFSSNQTFNRIKSKTDEFFYSLNYPITVMAIALFCWLGNFSLVAIAIFSLSACYLMITQRDMLPVIPILFGAVVCVRDMSIFSLSLPMIIIFIPAVVGIILHLILYPFKKKMLTPMFIALCLVSACLFLGGLFSNNYDCYSSGLVYIITIGIAMLAIYVFFYQYVTVKDGKKLVRYFCYTLLFTVNVGCFELVYALISNLLFKTSSPFASIYNPAYPFSFQPGNFCWANTIHIGYLTLLGVPITFYLMLNKKNLLPYIIQLVFLYLTAVLTMSAGTIGILAIFTPILFYNAHKRINVKHRKVFKIVTGIIVYFVLFVGLGLTVLKPTLISNLLGEFLNDNGRSEIYNVGVNAFISNPIFGAGLGYPFKAGVSGGYFHSTIIHTLGTMGLVGLAVYIFYFYVRLKTLTKKDSPFTHFAFTAFMMYELFAFIDNGEFCILMVFVTTLLTIVDLVSRKEERLPLFRNSDNLLLLN